MSTLRILVKMNGDSGVFQDRCRFLCCPAVFILRVTGVLRGKKVHTTNSRQEAAAEDRVNRQFVAERPGQLWVADFTYVSTWQGFAYVAFIIDVFAGVIVGWRVSSSMETTFVLDALEQVLWARRPSARLIKSYVGKIKHWPKWQHCWFFRKSCQPSGTTKRTTDLLPGEAANVRDDKGSGKQRRPLCAGLSGHWDHTLDFPEMVLRWSVETRCH